MARMELELVEARNMPMVAPEGLLARLQPKPGDPLLALIGAYRSDERPSKIDLGVGVYRNAEGETPVLQSVKAAELRLVAQQSSKSYVGPEGDTRFTELLLVLLTGGQAFDGRLKGLQTPGGTGALRLGMELIAAANPDARILVGTPSWPNHPPIIAAAHLEARVYPCFDVEAQAVRFETMLDALGAARQGDVALLHGCCHNPTGADLSEQQWAAVADIVERRGLVPLIDMAYQGLGEGIEADARGARALLERVPEALVAYSCSKNFGLYRERTGALFTLSRDAKAAAITQSNLVTLARANWSMPPDHGAAIVRTILDDEALAAEWRSELADMRAHLLSLRKMIAASDSRLAALGRQCGMFSTLPLSPEQVRKLCEEHAIYMPSSGRINVAGLSPATLPLFQAALAAVR